jgi:membrane-associated phospholipid phosphatase
VTVIQRAQRCSLLLAGVLGFASTLRSQSLPFDPQAGYASTPAVEPRTSSANETYAVRFPVTLGPNPFSTFSRSAASGPGQCTENFISCAHWQQPTPILLPAEAGSIPASGSTEATEPQERQVSWKLIIPNFLSDQKHIWLFPIHVMEGQHWRPALASVGVTAGLVALDPHDTPYFRKTGNFGTFNDAFKVTTTERVFLGLPVVYYFVGLGRRDSYAQQTALFAAEAIADVDVLAGVMRSVDGRLHPRDIPPNGDFTHTWFKAKGTYLNRGSFPSGHTAGAFAVATIFSRRYGRRYRWVPWIAYSLAGLTGISRITDSAHFPSDVFVGGLLAYSIGRYVVLRQP